MRIALVAPFPTLREPHSGVARYAVLLFERLQRAREDVYFISDRVSDASDARGGRVIPAWDSSWRWSGQVARALRKVKPDLVWLQHANFLYGKGLIAAMSPLLLLRRLRSQRVPVLLEMHDVRSLREIDSAFTKRHRHRVPAGLLRRALRFVVRSLTKLSSLILVHDQRAFDSLVDEYGVSARSIVIVPHLPFEAFAVDRAVARRTLQLADDRYALLFFGYASEYKGLDELLRAMEIVNRTPAGGRIFLLLAAGKNPHLATDSGYLERYANWQSAFDRLPNARWDGFVPEENISQYFSAADAVILPYTEVFGSSGPLARALSYAKVTLISDKIAPRDFPADLAFAPTAAEIATAIERLVEDGEFRQRLLASAQRCKTGLDSETGYERVLRTLASQHEQRDNPMSAAT